MDSITQIALGAAVSVAVMGRRTSISKAALAGAIAGTLPDLDVFIRHGDAIRNMTMHRAETHSAFYLTLAAPIVGYIFAAMFRQRNIALRWILAMWVALVTHPILDTMTVYGTQLGLPFTNYPFAVGSIFILDPLYTVPLIVGLVFAIRRDSLRANNIAIAMSTAYLGLGVLGQSYVRNLAYKELNSQASVMGISNNDKVLVTPTPLNIIGWRIIAVNDTAYSEGFFSFLKPDSPIRFNTFNRGAAIINEWKGDWYADRMEWFTRGFYSMDKTDTHIILTDLRMGQEPNYTFVFALADIRKEADEEGAEIVPISPYSVAKRPEVKDMFKRVSIDTTRFNEH